MRIFLAWNYDDRQQNGYIIASKAAPYKIKSSEIVRINSERNESVPVHVEPYHAERAVSVQNSAERADRRKRRKTQKGAEREFGSFDPLGSTPSRVAPSRIAQNSTAPVELVPRRLDISN